MVRCTAYRRTGFDAVNRPENLDVVKARGVSQVNVQVLDIIQVRGLSEIKIHGFETDIKDLDYFVLESFSDSTVNPSKTASFAYYTVSGYPPYRMTSLDTAVFNVVEDSFMELKGDKSSGLAFTQVWGRVVRETPEKDSEPSTNIIDPLLTQKYPSKRNYVDVIGTLNSETETFLGIPIIMSTIDLSDFNIDSYLQSVYRIDASSEDATNWNVEWNLPPYRPAQSTELVIQLPYNAFGTGSGRRQCKTIGYGLYDGRVSFVRQAIQKLWAMGMADAIQGAYFLPDSVSTITSETGGHISKIVCGEDGEFLVENYKGFSEKNTYPNVEESKALEFALKQCDTWKVGIITVANGNSLEMRRYQADDTVYYGADPHINGAPVFVYGPEKNILDTSGTGASPTLQVAGECLFSVVGGTWLPFPLSFTGSSGNMKGFMSLMQKRSFEQVNLGNYAASQYRGANADLAFSAMGGLENMLLPGSSDVTRMGGDSGTVNSMSVGGSFGGKSWGESVSPGGDWSKEARVNSPGSGGAITSFASQIYNNLNLMSDDPSRSSVANARLKQNQALMREMSGFVSDTTYVAPTVSGIIEEGLQELLGNGCIWYAFYPDERDVERWVKIINFFGAQTERMLEGGYMFDTPEHWLNDYHFVKIEGATFQRPGVGYSGDRWILDACAEALSVGVRFWRK